MGFEAWKLAMKGKSNGVQGMRRSKKATSGKTKGNAGNIKSNSPAKKNGASGSKRKKNRRNTVPEVFDEKRFRAEQDLRALTDAKEILDSPGRIKAAKEIAQERVEVARAAAESIDNL